MRLTLTVSKNPKTLLLPQSVRVMPLSLVTTLYVFTAVNDTVMTLSWTV